MTAKKSRHSHDGRAKRGLAMINDMASLKQAMEQMDSDDVVVAQAAKDRAAHILSEAGLNFAKLAELIEQRRLLLRPRILASIKRMDQPASLGDFGIPRYRRVATQGRPELSPDRRCTRADWRNRAPL